MEVNMTSFPCDLSNRFDVTSALFEPLMPVFLFSLDVSGVRKACRKQFEAFPLAVVMSPFPFLPGLWFHDRSNALFKAIDFDASLYQ
jgi:hypothetical protein